MRPPPQLSDANSIRYSLRMYGFAEWPATSVRINLFTGAFPHFLDDMLLNVAVSVTDELERMGKEAILEYCLLNAPAFRHTVMILISLKWRFLIGFINVKSVSISGIWTSEAFI